VTTPALVVLGAGLSQRPLIERAQARGLTTCVVDGRTDRPDAELDARTEAALAALHVIIEPMGDVEAMVARTEQLERERMGSA